MAASKVFLTGDAEPVLVNEAPDVFLEHLRKALAHIHGGPAEKVMIRVEMVPFTRDDHPRPAYIRPLAVTAVLPVHPDELEFIYDHPPEWDRLRSSD